jgi:glycosyltransferase involved in cell wall biosynthesis
LRILTVNNFAHVTGGADYHCLGLARALRARGHEVAFLSTAFDHNEEYEGEFVRCSVTNATRDGIGPSRKALVAAGAFWNQEAATALRRLLQSFRPDVVHLHKLYPQLSIAPAVLAARSAPVVQTLHDYELASASPFDHRGGRVDRRESKSSYRLLNTATDPLRRHVHSRLVDCFVAVSDTLAEVYARRGIEPFVLSNFVPDDVPEGRPVAASRRGILFAGRLSSEKGVLDVLELARRLPDTHVTVAGEGPLAGTVADESRRLANLHFVGHLSRRALVESMRSAELLVAPVRWHEPGPLVALEAMSAGTPIVAYDRGGLAEYVRRAEAGVLIESDPRALAAACRELRSRPERWRALSEAGPTAVRRYHSAERYVPHLEDVYRQAIRSRTRRTKRAGVRQLERRSELSGHRGSSVAPRRQARGSPRPGARRAGRSPDSR